MGGDDLFVCAQYWEYVSLCVWLWRVCAGFMEMFADFLLPALLSVTVAIVV